MAALCLLAGVAVLWAAPAEAATASFTYTGQEQTFTVSAGVNSLRIVAVGAKGDTGFAAGGGLGAVMSADLAVSPGQVLYA